VIQKIVNRFKLDRPLRYYTFLYVLVILLTYAGNFFFYQSVGVKEWVSIGSHIETVNKYSSLCTELTKGNTDKCLKEVKEFARNTSDYYGHKVLIGGEEIIDNRLYPNPNEREPIVRSGRLSSLNKSIEITRNSVPNIWYSVWRSATFSASQIIGKIKDGKSKEEIGRFIKRTAMWRSFPHFSFLFLVFFAGGLMKRSIIAQKELINELEELEAIELEELENKFDKKSDD